MCETTHVSEDDRVEPTAVGKTGPLFASWVDGRNRYGVASLAATPFFLFGEF